VTVQKRSEEINPKPNWLEKAEMPRIDRQWQLGTALLLTGIIVGVFDVFFGVVFIPEDLRGGSDFWVTIATIETLLAIVLIIAGFVMKHRASLERALQSQSSQ
jgi:hypothetical protein